jgi:hypothetical protein
MIQTMTLMACLLSQANSEAVGRIPAYQEGKATYYSPGLMERVARRRGIELDGMSGFATYPDCSYIGGRIWVSVLNPRTRLWSSWSQKRIVDCSQPRDYERHVRTGLIEFSYQDAKRYGYAREGRTRVRFYPPQRP